MTLAKMMTSSVRATPYRIKRQCSVVLADEPTGSLDKKNRDIVMRLLHELNEEGKTVIIVTHDQGIIEDEPYVVKI